MCLLIGKKAEGIVHKEELLEASHNNPNGMGVTYAKNGVLVTYKTMKNFKEFWKKIEDNMDCPMIIHFRFATQGTTNTFNLHPFNVREDLVFAHNGVIDIDTTDIKEKRSDTQIYNDYVLKLLPHGFENQEGILNLIGRDIGGYNKLTFMDNLGKLSFVNEKAGHWRDGVWYSNGSYRSYVFDRGGKSVGGLGKSENFTSCGGLGVGDWPEIEEDELVWDQFSQSYMTIEDYEFYYGEDYNPAHHIRS